MKAYVSDFNNILLETKKRINVTKDVSEADVIILWQDVRAAMRTLCEINNDYYKKPVVVIQHGRGATRDYCPPNSFKMLADRICVWGPREAERLDKANLKQRAIITGSPLTFYTRKAPKRIEEDKTVIVFAPVIADKERPENLEVFYKLKQIEYEKAMEKLRANQEALRLIWHGWAVDEKCATEGTVPYDLLRKDFYLLAKLTSIHDRELYHGLQVRTEVCHVGHLTETIKLLANADCIVGMEEGTMHLMASYLGVPTVIVDGFKYGDFGGTKNYDTCEIIKSPASAFTNIDNLRSTIEYEIAHKHERQDARDKVVREEFDPYPDKDPIELIIDVASELAGGDIRRVNELQEVLHGN